MTKNTDINKNGSQPNSGGSNSDLSTEQVNNYQKILDDYNDYQSNIRHEGNPANRMRLWKELCEDWAMTSERFSKVLKEAQEWKEKQPKPDKDFVSYLKDWVAGKLSGQEKDDGVKLMLTSDYQKGWGIIDMDDIFDGAMDKLSPLKSILDLPDNATVPGARFRKNTTSLSTFDEDEKIRDILDDELCLGRGNKKDWDEEDVRGGLIDIIKEKLTNSLAEDYLDEIEGLIETARSKINEA